MADAANSIANGSCLCGAVQYKVTGVPTNQGMCHCINCKRWTGSAFATNWWYTKDQFCITTGSANLRSYISSTTDEGRTVERFSCATCSSSLYITIANRPQVVVVSAGSLDEGPKEAPRNEYFTKDRVGWIPAIDGSKQN